MIYSTLALKGLKDISIHLSSVTLNDFEKKKQFIHKVMSFIQTILQREDIKG